MLRSKPYPYTEDEKMAVEAHAKKYINARKIMAVLGLDVKDVLVYPFAMPDCTIMMTDLYLALSDQETLIKLMKKLEEIKSDE